MKSRKWKKISALLFLGIALLFLLMPTYMQEALIHWFPDISDTYIFPSNTVGKADSCWEWPVARDANRYRMTDDEEAYLEKYGTVAYLVIQDDGMRNTGKIGHRKSFPIYFPLLKVLSACWSA